ncbi:MAG: ROK family protein [Anaerolineae bacterium]
MIGAVDIGGTKIAVGLVTREGEVVRTTNLPTRREQPYRDGLDNIAAALEDLLADHAARLDGIGIGTTGRLTPSGALTPNAFLPPWTGHTPADDLAAQFGVTAAIENDADAAALAEARWGSSHDVERLIYVTVSTGIGAGVVLGGRLYRGVAGCHPELGHHVIDPAGPPCFCGARGCWESLASGSALAAWAQAHGGDADWDAQRVCDLAEAGHPLARQAVERGARYLGIGFANLITLFAPDCVTLGGGMMRRWDLFRPGVMTVIEEQCGLVPWPSVRLGLARVPQPGLAGAAAVLLQQFD